MTITIRTTSILYIIIPFFFRKDTTNFTFVKIFAGYFVKLGFTSVSNFPISS